jgi:hypothetical protein
MLLTIADIQEWLADNETAFLAISPNQPPPLDNALYFMYRRLQEFVCYVSCIKDCEAALEQLNRIGDNDAAGLKNWAQTHEELGAKKLLLFMVNYLDWTEAVAPGSIKICEGLYTESAPFEKLIAFCGAFQRLYWNG